MKGTISNLFFEQEEAENRYHHMRKRHLKEWPDDTFRIKEEYGNALSKFHKQLTVEKVTLHVSIPGRPRLPSVITRKEQSSFG